MEFTQAQQQEMEKVAQTYKNRWPADIRKVDTGKYEIVTGEGESEKVVASIAQVDGGKWISSVIGEEVKFKTSTRAYAASQIVLAESKPKRVPIKRQEKTTASQQRPVPVTA